MEMESDQPDDVGNCIEETSVQHLFDPGSPDISNMFGEQQVAPRVGDAYQVEIPSMTMDAEQYKLLTNPAHSKVVDGSHYFLVGLPVPIVYSDEVNNIEDHRLESPINPDNVVNGKSSKEARKRKKDPTRLRKKSSKLKVAPLLFGLDEVDESKAENIELMVVEENANQSLRSKCCYPVPGSSRSTWSDAEVDGFLLGLYIFGKSFYQVKRFMENKAMGEILSFYYGKFYGSDAYRRWSECRKSRRKKCILGEKIFTGWRQRELLSRIIPHVSEESQKSLSEGYKLFAEGTTSLEEYVTFLKSIVGIRVLVEAIGIGKGKEDLTGFALEPGKNNQELPACPKLPACKAFSSLTFSEIIKYLTGGVRLSKGRSNDIFWEAVWPRLLANGWHSEQPTFSLVFLMPGIKKFKRRKLTRGDQYFDSVSDVLNKVASEPELIQLQGEEELVPEATSDQDDLSNHQRHCYLKPRVVTSKPNRMQFTVVDTSLVHGAKSRGIVELKYSPVELQSNSEQPNCSRENEGNSCENKLNGHGNDTAEMQLNSKPNMAKHLKRKRFTIVDTSLVHRGKSSTVIELRCSPTVFESVSKSTGLLREIEETSSPDLLGKHKPDAADISLDGDVNNFSDNCHRDTSDIGGTNQMEVTNKADSAEKIECHPDQKTGMSDNKKLKRTTLHKFSRKEKYKHSNSVCPLPKRRRLAACAKAETGCLVNTCSQGLESEQVGPHGTLSSLDVGELVVSLAGPLEREPSIASLAEGGPVKENTSETCGGNCSGERMSHEKNENHQDQESSRLNLRDSMDSENVVVVNLEINVDSPCLPSSETHVVDTLSTSNMISRRQSTRNRPLTPKALEALADGLLGVKKRKNNSEDVPGVKRVSKPSSKARRRVKVTSSHADTVSEVRASEENKVNEALNVSKDTDSKPLDQTGEKWPTGC
ncbi:hypothetical protein D8674_041381 [Pyrus ussuriensis x Pyrus communis]|uniref:SANT domain-containing protein n=1 Tax=Pyrus ussuriensis x Pyrus communis TaxID=2448454 RepID=A0A5N5FNN2_9ROSA|nr:hypothetical protein D8674_041381 [Pyrus ussuriensis x Pyrus communis]